MKLFLNGKVITQGSLNHCIDELLENCYTLDSQGIDEIKLNIKERRNCHITYGYDEFLIK